MRNVLKITSNFLILIPLFLVVLVLSINFNKPFIGHHDFMSAHEGTIAKNYLKHGYLELKFGGMLSSGSFSTHHPPLYPILISFSFFIFGIHEWAERLVPVAFSFIGVFFLFLICKKLWNKDIALMSSLFFVLNPMFIYFGNIPILDFAVLFLMLAAIFLYLLWLKGKANKYLILFLGTIFVAGLIDWTIVYLPPLLVLHSIIMKKFDHKLLLSIGVAFLTVILLMVHNFILTGVVISEEIIRTLQFRLVEKSLSFGGEEFTLLNYLRKELSWIQAYFTRIMLILSGIYVLCNLNFKINLQKSIMLVLLLLGLAHPILFSRYVFIHDFLNVYLLPFFAISAALGLKIIIIFFKKIKVNRIIIAMVVVVVFTLFIVERLQFTKALIKTNMNKQGKEMAEVLNKLQNAPNQATIISPRFNSFYGNFTDFYSTHPYGITNEDDLREGIEYKYIITIDEDIQDRAFYEQLIKDNRYQKIGDWTVIYKK